MTKQRMVRKIKNILKQKHKFHKISQIYYDLCKQDLLIKILLTSENN